MGRRERLRLETQNQHAALDRLIEERRYFDSFAGYASWLRSALAFNRDMERLLAQSPAAASLPMAALRQRIGLLEKDLADLNVIDVGGSVMAHRAQLSAMEALGILYVTEGASLGSRVLLVRARHLGFSDGCGAKHLAYAAQCIGHWRAVVTMLDAFPCGTEEEEPMIAAAQWAFDVALSHWTRP